MNEVVVELKAQISLTGIDEAQLIDSLKCCRRDTGLIINFGETSLTWHRFRN